MVLGSGRFMIAGGALLLFTTNLVAIILVSVVVFLLVGFRPTRDRRKRQVTRAIFISIISVLILAVPLGIQTGTVARKAQIEAMIDSIVRKDFADRAVPMTRFELIDLLRESDAYEARSGTYDIETSGGGYLFAFEDAAQAGTWGRLVESVCRN